MTNNTIFVQIASYRDPECRNTVNDLYAKSKFPENIFLGINWQYDEEDSFEAIYEDQPFKKQISIARFHRTEAKGVCWARAQTQKLYNNEAYTLQIDSHMVFIKNWDVELIAMITSLKDRGIEKPIISHYPPNYTIEGKYDQWQGRMAPYIREDDQVVYFKMTGFKIDQNNKPPQPSASIAGGFLFADARLIKEFPYDPHLYFYGEEITLTTRFWTHGWDIYNPTKIVLWHLFKVEIKNGEKIDTRSIDTHWDDYPDEYTKLNDRSIYRTRHFFGTEYSTEDVVVKDIQLYGLGKQRSLYQYELFSGIDFKYLQRNGFASKGLVFNEGVVVDHHNASKKMLKLSTLSSEFNYAQNLFELFELLAIKSIVNLLSRYHDPLAGFVQPSMNYIGLDCNDDNNQSNRFEHRYKQNMQYMLFNYFQEPLPICDALVAINVLEKLTYAEVMTILVGAVKSNVKYLVCSAEVLKHSPYYFPKPSFMLSLNTNEDRTVGVWEMKDIFIYCHAMDESHIHLRQMIVPKIEQLLKVVQNALGEMDDDYFEILYQIYSSTSPNQARAITNKEKVKIALTNNLSVGRKAINLLIHMRYWDKFKPIARELPQIKQNNSNYTFMSALVSEYLRLYCLFCKE